MKKNNCAPLALLVLACILLITACQPEKEEDPVRAAPAWLIGTWTSGTWENGPRVTFTVDTSYRFTCQFATVTDSATTPASVAGTLLYAVDALKFNEYIMYTMATPVVDATDPNYQGNEDIRQDIDDLNNHYEDAFNVFGFPGTLTPNASKSEFVFSSDNIYAQGWFGGTYTKQP